MDYSAHIRLSANTFSRLGFIGIQSIFSICVVLILYVTWFIPGVSFVLPVVFLGLSCVWILFRHPLLNLGTVLAAFVLIVDFEDGIQVTEVFYGMYYLGFLVHWFVTRIFFTRQKVFVQREDKILFLFLILMTLSLSITLLFGGKLSAARGEWLSLSFLAFYFPVREAVATHKRGIIVILGVIAWLGLFVLVRNVLNYQQMLLNASYAYQVIHGRAVTNEGPLLAAAMMALVFYLFTNRWYFRIPAAAAFLSFIGGLLLTQSRGYWLAFIAGTIFLFLLVSWKHRIKLVTACLLSGFLILGLATIVLGDFVLLIISGLMDRFLSIANASSTDISLVNRILESKAVLSKIAENPILGYGMGVPYSVYDITYETTVTKSFVHNGYIALWYKFGLWGLMMILFFFGGIMYRAYRTFKSSIRVSLVGVCCAGAVASFAALAVTANTSNPFYMNDLMFLYAVLAGLIGGCYTLSLSGETEWTSPLRW